MKESFQRCDENTSSSPVSEEGTSSQPSPLKPDEQREEIQTCITPVDSIIMGQQVTRGEEVSSEMEKPDEEISSFHSLVESLRKRGAIVQVIPTDAEERASYNYRTDTVRVHEGDFFNGFEEAIHRIQTKVIKKSGFRTEPSIDTSLVLAAEVGAASQLIKISEQELDEIEKKFEKLDAEITEEDVKKMTRLEGEISAEHDILINYQAKLFSVLKRLGKEQLENYKKLFKHPLFAGAGNVARWVEAGLKSPELIPVHDSSDFSTCFINS
ncbi:hypothetical protein M1349_04300 [Patescibacteria group bacterium]|nr:hypothetical protein [Patescibacteria group bacterium]